MEQEANSQEPAISDSTSHETQREEPNAKSSDKKTAKKDSPNKSTAKSASKKTTVGKKNATAKKVAAKKNVASKATVPTKAASPTPNYPRHDVEKALRIPKAILDQNAGRDSSELEAAKFVGINNVSGPFAVEISSSLKYGFLERPESKQLRLTDLAKKILRPQAPDDELKGYRQAILNAPVISEVYKHYRGENLPDRKFFENALTDTFKLPAEKLSEFIDIFLSSLTTARLVEKIGDKYRLIDVSSEGGKTFVDTDSEIKKLSKSATVSAGDTCFVMMPFATPIGDYYKKIYEPAIEKAGLIPIRADNEIFGVGKIIDQIWNGINSAKVLIGELTGRNANVFYELGIAHALKKPVVLISSNENDVPFDLQHIRVIYYDVFDPFWGQKLIDKVAENILSAIKNPEETILF